MKQVFISSYYSEADWRDNEDASIDGLYRVDYLDDVDIKKEIAQTYRDFEDADEIVTSLEMVLHDLWKNKKVVSWIKIKCEKFDCDYGTFLEE